jgi:CO/xanthine dehydrogenase Mo-binding subunit
MDQVARRLGMDPMELRLINAYRDGDMKAHRKTVEGAALVEVIQAAARQTGKTLPPRFAQMSSMKREA